jgi:hypothetical protein
MRTSLYSPPHFGQAKSSSGRRLFMMSLWDLRVTARMSTPLVSEKKDGP